MSALRSLVSRLTRDLKARPGLARMALPDTPLTAAVGRALRRMPAPVRGAVPFCVRGLPEGLDPAEADTLCRQVLGAPLGGAAFVHLTGWKSSWVYRVFLRSTEGQRTSVVYKNAVFDTHLIPALQGLPILPGPPEFAVYDALAHPTAASLRAQLPAVYRCREVERGRHFQFVLEDLGTCYRTDYGTEARLRVAAALPALHRALRDAEPALAPERLPAYDPAFRVQLLDYAEGPLRRYHEATGSHPAGVLLDRWDAVREAYLSHEPNEEALIQPLHGDPNRTNALFHRRTGEIRFIDWEWAGTGLPHHDLACVIGAAPEAAEVQALKAFTAAAPGVLPGVHRRLYLRCKLERGLFSGAFLAVQTLDAEDATGFDVDGKLATAVAALQHLETSRMPAGHAA